MWVYFSAALGTFYGTVIGLLLYAHLKRRRTERDLKDRLQSLEAERQECIKTLTLIATLPVTTRVAIDLADGQLRAMGFVPVRVDENCPPDQVFFTGPDVKIQPTDYI